MNKISLKNFNLKEVEQLSREQLKNVFGGGTGRTTSGESTTTEAPSDCIYNKDCPGGCQLGDYCSTCCVA